MSPRRNLSEVQSQNEVMELDPRERVFVKCPYCNEGVLISPSIVGRARNSKNGRQVGLGFCDGSHGCQKYFRITADLLAPNSLHPERETKGVIPRTIKVDRSQPHFQPQSRATARSGP